MSKQVRISEEIYDLIQSDAIPLVDTVDSVLQRWARELGKFPASPGERKRGEEEFMSHTSVPNRKFSGKKLNQEWNVRAKHALYHKEGNWFNNLTQFPGALFDPDGYLLFKTEEELMNCRFITVGVETHCKPPISEIPGYVKMR